MTTTHQSDPVTSELPIYQGLLNELDPDARATVIEQQGEGHTTSAPALDDGHQHIARHS
ncbi:hypothetical protein [Solicola gregarius]|uniref:Uncharacterized protein n=1 Tax=Solicola gregarius TaxID=2908642 RepID=A0AA46THA3_9ACTN|nr:hypothetical protein [Solicola gregarius]UYM05163.1 hypothetical protein L0C25_22005 [Solicola gregarius]